MKFFCLTLTSSFLLLACAAPNYFTVQQSPTERARYEGRAENFLVAAQGKAAGAAAKEIYAASGNLIDAAVAASFVISVERPHSTGIGGGGFLLYFEAKTKKTYAIDFRERAPLASHRDMFLQRGEVIPDRSVDGIHAVAVPGLVAGLLELHRKFGRLPLPQVMAPAISLAKNGLVVYPSLAKALREKRETLRLFPTTRKIFLREDGEPYEVGETIFQRDLAASLNTLAREGAAAFYRGKIRDEILRESRRWGGKLSKKDFSRYTVKWREPVRGTFRGLEIHSMPPPSSGGVHVVQVLNLLEPYPLKEDGFLSAENIHRTAAALQLAFADRSEYLGDPDFVPVPVTALTGKAYADHLRASITEKARASTLVKPGLEGKKESFETTHLSLMDKEGNAVATTQTINLYFGSGLVAGNTGILLNNEMDDFSAKAGVPNAFGAVGGMANSIAPAKTPLSSMSPTLVMRGGEPVMAVGAPGGTRIISCVAQTILNYFAYRLPIYDSVAAVRVHHQWQPDRLDIDAPGPGPAVVEALKQKGYEIKMGDDAVGCRVEAVVKEGNSFHGAADPRDLGVVERL